ncbi:hypothetical protein ACFLSJ_06260 [Verrucomicrobiota bacterium]
MKVCWDASATRRRGDLLGSVAVLTAILVLSSVALPWRPSERMLTLHPAAGSEPCPPLPADSGPVGVYVYWIRPGITNMVQVAHAFPGDPASEVLEIHPYVDFDKWAAGRQTGFLFEANLGTLWRLQDTNTKASVKYELMHLLDNVETNMAALLDSEKFRTVYRPRFGGCLSAAADRACSDADFKEALNTTTERIGEALGVRLTPVLPEILGDVLGDMTKRAWDDLGEAVLLMRPTEPSGLSTLAEDILRNSEVQAAAAEALRDILRDPQAVAGVRSMATLFSQELKEDGHFTALVGDLVQDPAFSSYLDRISNDAVKTAREVAKLLLTVDGRGAELDHVAALVIKALAFGDKDPRQRWFILLVEPGLAGALQRIGFRPLDLAEGGAAHER